MPTSAIIVVLTILLVLQYLTMLNKGAGFLSKTAIAVFGETLTWETVIVWVLGVTVAGLALGIVISNRYAPVDRWYASLLLAVMAGHCTCIWKTQDAAWRKAYLRQLSEKEAKEKQSL